MNLPDGYQTVMPYLILKDAAGFLEFAKNVFGAAEVNKYLNDDGSIMHAEISIGGSMIMFGESSAQWKPITGGLYINVENADDTYNLAVKQGAVSVMEPSDQSYGRSCGVVDPFGNTWWITTPK